MESHLDPSLDRSSRLGPVLAPQWDEECPGGDPGFAHDHAKPGPAPSPPLDTECLDGQPPAQNVPARQSLTDLVFGLDIREIVTAPSFSSANSSDDWTPNPAGSNPRDQHGSTDYKFSNEFNAQLFGTINSHIRHDRSDELLELINIDGRRHIPANLVNDPLLSVVIFAKKTQLAVKLIEKVESAKLWQVNIYGDTPLHIAAIMGDITVAKALLRKEPLLMEAVNKQRETALHKAATYGQKSMFWCLVKESKMESVVSYRKGDGSNVLHCAITGNAPMLALDIARKWNELIFCRDEAASTPLHLAATVPNFVRGPPTDDPLRSFLYKLIPIKEDDSKNAIADERSIWERARSCGSRWSTAFWNTWRTCVDGCFLCLCWTCLAALCWPCSAFRSYTYAADEESHERRARPPGQFAAENCDPRPAPTPTESGPVRVAVRVEKYPATTRTSGHVHWHRHSVRSKSPSKCASILHLIELTVSGSLRVVFKILKQLCPCLKDMEILKRKNVAAMELVGYLANEKDYDFYCKGYSSIPHPTVFDAMQSPSDLEYASRDDSLQHGNGATETAVLTEELKTIMKKPTPNRWTEPPLIIAAKHGLHNLVHKIVQVCPRSAIYLDSKGRNVLQVAIRSGHKEVVSVLCEMLQGSNPILPSYLSSMFDNKSTRNTILHLAAKNSPIHGAGALQMYHELKWFDMVEKIIPKDLVNSLNKAGKTAHELFTKRHEKTLQRCNEQLVEIAKVSMALVVAAMFTSSFTIPSKKDNEADKVILTIFSHAYVIGFGCASMALLVFLDLIQGGYKVAKFREDIPVHLAFAWRSFALALLAFLLSYICNIILQIYGGKMNKKQCVVFVLELFLLPCICSYLLKVRRANNRSERRF